MIKFVQIMAQGGRIWGHNWRSFIWEFLGKDFLKTNRTIIHINMQALSGSADFRLFKEGGRLQNFIWNCLLLFLNILLKTRRAIICHHWYMQAYIKGLRSALLLYNPWIAKMPCMGTAVQIMAWGWRRGVGLGQIRDQRFKWEIFLYQ